MNDSAPNADRGKRFARVGVAIVVVLYAMYLVLPVMPNRDIFGAQNSTIRGWQGLGICFEFFPVFWPLALGHTSHWIGTALLANRYWRSATFFGLFALVPSACLIPSMMIGYAMKLGSMAALMAAGAIGWRQFGHVHNRNNG